MTCSCWVIGYCKVRQDFWDYMTYLCQVISYCKVRWMSESMWSNAIIFLSFACSFKSSWHQHVFFCDVCRGVHLFSLGIAHQVLTVGFVTMCRPKTWMSFWRNCLRTHDVMEQRLCVLTPLRWSTLATWTPVLHLLCRGSYTVSVHVCYVRVVVYVHAYTWACVCTYSDVHVCVTDLYACACVCV